MQDASGLVSAVATRLPAADGARHTVVVPLDVALSGGHPRAYPLTVTAVKVLPQPDVRPARLDLELIRVGARGTADTWAAPLPGGQTWSDGTAHAADATKGACKGQPADSYVPGTPGVCAIVPGGSKVFRTTVSTGIPASRAVGDAFGGLTDSDYATEVGSQVRLVAGPVGGPAPLPVRVNASALRDAPECGRHHHAGSGRRPGHRPHCGPRRRVARAGPRTGVSDCRPAPPRHRLDAGRCRPGKARVLVAGQHRQRAHGRGRRGAARAGPRHHHGAHRRVAASRPVPQGLGRVLELVRYLAPGFAVIAFTVHAVVSTRQRRKEFALLRAIGVRSKSLSALLGAEQLGLALFAVVPGALMGMALASAVLPLVTVDDSGQAPIRRCRRSHPGAPWR